MEFLAGLFEKTRSCSTLRNFQITAVGTWGPDQHCTILLLRSASLRVFTLKPWNAMVNVNLASSMIFPQWCGSQTSYDCIWLLWISKIHLKYHRDIMDYHGDIMGISWIIEKIAMDRDNLHDIPMTIEYQANHHPLGSFSATSCCSGATRPVRWPWGPDAEPYVCDVNNVMFVAMSILYNWYYRIHLYVYICAMVKTWYWFHGHQFRGHRSSRLPIASHSGSSLLAKKKMDYINISIRICISIYSRTSRLSISVYIYI